MKVVIVEDEIRIRKGLGNLLGQYNDVEVCGLAKNGIEGVEVIMRNQPDVVFTDIRMPEMDGLAMLECIQRQGFHCHYVILTGFAEFDYARRAMKCGADDYLLKPITIDDVENVLTRVRKKLKDEAGKIPESSMECLRRIISGEHNLDDMVEANRIYRLLDIKENERTVLISGTIGELSQNKMQMILSDTLHGNVKEKTEDEHASEREAIKDVTLFNNKYLYALIHQRTNKSLEEYIIEIEMRLFHCMLLEQSEEAFFVVEGIRTLKDIKPTVEHMRTQLYLGLYANERVVTLDRCIQMADKLNRVSSGLFTFDFHWMDRLKEILCNGSVDQYRLFENDFFQTLKNNNCSIEAIRQSCVNVTSWMTNFAAQTYPEKVKKITEMHTHEHLQEAVTWGELRRWFRGPAICMLEASHQEDGIRNYTIMKAIGYIRLHYAERISQEEVAKYLHITPEYLSTLFNKEMGQNFSSFLNAFRISNAKRMLRGTNNRISDIAGTVGFTDTKYFNKVFREIVGVTPTQFREEG